MPTTTVTTKFFTYRQNNSGGYFIGPSRVSIEAMNAKQANALAADLLEGRDQWCGCCGKRWSDCDDDDGHEEPTLYGQPLRTESPNSYRIHFLDGRVEESPAPTASAS